jgi:hypothetical protein
LFVALAWLPSLLDRISCSWGVEFSHGVEPPAGMKPAYL